MTRQVITIALLFIAATAAAQEGPWSGKATFGYLATTGNTENSNLNSGFEVQYEPGAWLHRMRLSAVNAAENDETTAEAYEFGWKSEWNIDERQFIVGRLNWRKDRFSGYDTQFTQSVGYGRRLIETERHALSAEVAVGARQSDLFDGTTEDEFITRGGIEYRWQISETAQFTQDVAIESGAENTFVESVSKVSATLVGDLALVFSYTVRNNSSVPLDRQNTDTFTAISLEYLF
jgi:putative salt-induced outer membrane protein